jgi:hypothetical protein
MSLFNDGELQAHPLDYSVNFSADEGWTITHIPSGMIAGLHNVGEALRLVDLLSEAAAPLLQ